MPSSAHVQTSTRNALTSFSPVGSDDHSPAPSLYSSLSPSPSFSPSLISIRSTSYDFVPTASSEVSTEVSGTGGDLNAQLSEDDVTLEVILAIVGALLLVGFIVTIASIYAVKQS